MKVADLRQFLVSLASPLDAAGGKTAANDLRRAADGFAPFADMAVPAFADFLEQAKTYRDTGLLPVSGKKPKAPPRAKTPPLDVDGAVAKYQSLVERGATETLSDAVITEELKPLEKLTKPLLEQVARRVGIHKALKTKGAALDELRRKLVDGRDTHERVRMGIEDPPASRED